MVRVRRPLIVAVALLILSTASAGTQNRADDEQRLIESLHLVTGSVVAEIGAGDGALTLGIARHVGASGRVFTSELGAERLRVLREAVEKSKLSQVEVVEAHPMQTNLPDACCDAILMRDVYHHFGDPAAMNASLLAALRSGGRLAVIDFEPPPGGESATPDGRTKDGHHGVGRRTVADELKAAGFVALVTTGIQDRRFMVVGQKP
jgi:ubiquinone/menaquinone biosynthesis C-methylase UbiE